MTIKHYVCFPSMFPGTLFSASNPIFLSWHCSSLTASLCNCEILLQNIALSHSFIAVHDRRFGGWIMHHQITVCPSKCHENTHFIAFKLKQKNINDLRYWWPTYCTQCNTNKMVRACIKAEVHSSVVGISSMNKMFVLGSMNYGFVP